MSIGMNMCLWVYVWYMGGSGEGVNVLSLGNFVENIIKFFDFGLVIMVLNLLLERKRWWVD